MSTYYIRMTGDTDEDMKKSTNILGEVSFKTFYADLGFNALVNLVNNGTPEQIAETEILDDKNKRYTIEEFLDGLKAYKILTQ